MSYQQFSNPPPPAPVMAGTTSSSATTVVHSGQPSVVAAQPQPYNPFALKANLTKKLGITQVVMGSISILLGIIMIVVSPDFFISISGGGIWSGIFIIIAGSLCIAAGSNPNVYGTRCGALTMCIISIIFLTVCGLLNCIGFGVGVACRKSCYFNSFDQTTICYTNCDNIYGAGPYLSLLIAIMMLALFVITLMSAIYTGRGCCGNTGNSGYVVTQPMPASGGIIVSNSQTGSNIAAPYQHQGYAPPASAGYPPASAGYPPASTGYPTTSAYHPPQSAGYQQPYPGQGQQYSQTATTQGGVTYGADYSQQKSGLPNTNESEKY